MYTEDGEVELGEEEGEEPVSLMDKIRDQKDMMEGVKNQPWPIARKLQVLRYSCTPRHSPGPSSSPHSGQSLLTGAVLLPHYKKMWSEVVNFQ